MRETRQVRRGGCRNDDTFRDFYFTSAELIFCEYRDFRKPSKHIVSTPTTPLPPDNDQSRRNMWFRRPDPPCLTTAAATSAPTAYVRNCDGANWSNVLLPTLLALVEVVGMAGVSNGDDGHVGTMKTVGLAI